MSLPVEDYALPLGPIFGHLADGQRWTLKGDCHCSIMNDTIQNLVQENIALGRCFILGLTRGIEIHAFEGDSIYNWVKRHPRCPNDNTQINKIYYFATNALLKNEFIYVGEQEVGAFNNDFTEMLELLIAASKGKLTKLEWQRASVRLHITEPLLELPFPKVKELIEEVADEMPDVGEAEVIYQLANRFAKGLDIEKNSVFARKLYQIAADLGHMYAKRHYANCLFTGKGGPTDKRLARRYYTEAHEAGDLASTMNLAELLYNGEGGGLDLIQARALYSQAHEMGNPQATKRLARMLYEGEGGEPNKKRARELDPDLKSWCVIC